MRSGYPTTTTSPWPAGTVPAGRRRISDDAVGLAALLALLAEHGDTPEDPVPVAIETPRGLLTACLRATGRPVNPDVAGPLPGPALGRRRKSDHGDSVVPANVLRTPGFLAAFPARASILRPEARTVLAAAPDPARRSLSHQADPGLVAERECARYWHTQACLHRCRDRGQPARHGRADPTAARRSVRPAA
jgi:hypothetical protein